MSEPDEYELLEAEEYAAADDQAEPGLEAQFPPAAPPVPCLDDDCRYEPCYSIEPLKTTLIPLSKKKYASRDEAKARAEQLAKLRKLKFMRMFETARDYVAQCCERQFKVVT